MEEVEFVLFFFRCFLLYSSWGTYDIIIHFISIFFQHRNKVIIIKEYFCCRDFPLVELNIKIKSLLKLFVVVLLLRLEKKIEMD